MNILKDLSKNATVVKARAMYGNRLKYEHYKELLNKKGWARNGQCAGKPKPRISILNIWI